jgi:hypothetical protein
MFAWAGHDELLHSSVSFGTSWLGHRQHFQYSYKNSTLLEQTAMRHSGVTQAAQYKVLDQD